MKSMLRRATTLTPSLSEQQICNGDAQQPCDEQGSLLTEVASEKLRASWNSKICNGDAQQPCDEQGSLLTDVVSEKLRDGDDENEDRHDLEEEVTQHGSKGKGHGPYKAPGNTPSEEKDAGVCLAGKGGKGPSKGKAKGQLMGMGKGKGKKGSIGPPPPTSGGKGHDGSGPGAAKAWFHASNRGKSPFEKRLHWVKPAYDTADHATIYDSSKAPMFNPDMITSLLSPQEARLMGRRSFTIKKEVGICVLNNMRAQNMAITMNRLCIPLETLCEHLFTLDYTHPDVQAEDLELLLDKLPSPDEAGAILKHGDRPELLRGIERQLLPLCRLSAAGPRIRLSHLALTHEARYGSLLDHVQCLQAASTEVLASGRLRELFRVVLQISNYINHGTCAGALSFSVKSLAAFASFKERGFCALQCLCTALCSMDFVQGLEKDLEHVHQAALHSSAALGQEVVAFAGAVAFVESALQTVGVCDLAAARAALLLEPLRCELDALQLALDQAMLACEEAQRFCGEKMDDSQVLPCEEFFSCLSNFMAQLASAVKVHASGQASVGKLRRSCNQHKSQ